MRSDRCIATISIKLPIFQGISRWRKIQLNKRNICRWIKRHQQTLGCLQIPLWWTGGKIKNKHTIAMNSLIGHYLYIFDMFYRSLIMSLTWHAVSFWKLVEPACAPICWPESWVITRRAQLSIMMLPLCEEWDSSKVSTFISRTNHSDSGSS